MSKQPTVPPPYSEEFKLLTPSQRGGKARAANLSEGERSAIASKGGRAKWLKSLPRASHRGNFKGELGIDVDCYVLDDELHTAVISQRGMGVAVGMGASGGGRILRFLGSKRVANFGGPELLQKMSNPLIFRWEPLAPNDPPPSIVYGYDVTLLIDACKLIIVAADEDALGSRYQGMVKQAHIILNASAKLGIKALVHAIAGYDATKEDVIAAFKFYVREEAREYEKEFPEQLYDEWYRLYDLPRPERNRPFKFKALTIDHVYEPLAKSSGKILRLTRAARAMSGKPSKKLHQFLEEIGVKALRLHLGQLLGLAYASPDRSTYERLVEKRFGTQLRLGYFADGEERAI